MTDTDTRPGLGRPWRRTVKHVLQRDHYVCQIRTPAICTETATTADHINPRSKGGSDNPDNLRASCEPCNRHRGNGPNPVTDESRWSRQWT